MINVKSSLLKGGEVVVVKDGSEAHIELDANEQHSKESFADSCKSIHLSD